MQKVTLGIVTALVISSSTVYASNFTDAISNGKLEGDVSLYTTSRKQDKELGGYYSDTAYSTASLGLNYTTGNYNNFSAKVGFRTHKPIWEDDKNFNSGHGSGDASERIYEDEGHTLLSDLYLMYKTDKVTAKVGRQKISTLFIGHRHDAATLNANLTDKLNMEFIYTLGQSKVNYYQLQPMKDKTEKIFGGDSGLYKLGFSYAFDNGLKPSVYGLVAPDAHDIYGASLSYKSPNSPLKLFAMHNKQDLDNDDKDYKYSKFQIGYDFSGIKVNAGYVLVGEDGFQTAKYNAAANPFFNGDQLFRPDAKTPFINVSTKVADTDLGLTYGITEYNVGTVDYKKSELNLSAKYQINENLMAKLWYNWDNMDEDDPALTDMHEVALHLEYKF